MQVTLNGIIPVRQGIWSTKLSDAEKSFLGTAQAAGSDLNIIVLTKPAVESKSGSLTFPVDGFEYLRSSESEAALFIDQSSVLALLEAPQLGRPEESPISGDQEFIALVDVMLTGEANLAAKQLLSSVRGRHSGDLKKGLRNNFSETPDNFWYVIVQPRKQNLSITIRGEVSDFPNASLNLYDDRGNTRFYLSERSEIPAALDLIFSARRK